jgi:hypothetical protein
VEGTFIAIAPEVELQALQLDAETVGHHVDGETGEVGLPVSGQLHVNSGISNWIT